MMFEKTRIGDCDVVPAPKNWCVFKRDGHGGHVFLWSDGCWHGTMWNQKKGDYEYMKKKEAKLAARVYNATVGIELECGGCC
jgi:hypothetical protein